MAERVVRDRVDDLERERGHSVKADEQVVFGIDSVSYVVDLSSSNAEALRKALEDYIRVGNRLISQATRDGLTPAQAKRIELGEVRSWAAKQGIVVSERGRIPGDILEKYERAHGPLAHQSL